MIFPSLFPATALAASRSAAAPPLTKPQQIVDLAGVSVVRLELSYLPASGKTPVNCTSLGTIVASWPAQSAADKNTWVLTDGSLLNASKKNTCAPDGHLASIQVLASHEFTNAQPAVAQLALLTCTTTTVCSDSVPETLLTPGNGASLFSFHSISPLPFVTVEQAATDGMPAPTSIELGDSNNTIPPTKNVGVTTLTVFLTPFANATAPGSAPATPSTGSTQTPEPGMPYIDGNGNITGSQRSDTKSLVKTSDLQTLQQQVVVPAGQTLDQLLSKNTLSQQWDTGIIAYEQGRSNEAIQALRSIQNDLPAFQAPATFIAKAQANLPTTSGTPGSNSGTPQRQNNQGGLLGIPTLWIIGLIAAILVLVLLLVLVSIIYGRKRLERSLEEKSKGAFSVFLQTQLSRLNNLFKQVLQKRAPDSKSLDQHTPHSQLIPASSNALCPNCRQKVPNSATFCPNCRYPLLPDVQGSHQTVNTSLASIQPVVVVPSPQSSIRPQPQQPAQAPNMRDDPAIRAALERLWDKAGR